MERRRIMEAQQINRGAISEIWHRYKSRATAKGWDFDISREDFERIILSPCYYTGLGPSNSWRTLKYNGLDRIDSSRGYTLENVVPCHRIVNTMKLAMSQQEFLTLCRLIAKTHPEPIST